MDLDKIFKEVKETKTVFEESFLNYYQKRKSLKNVDEESLKKSIRRIKEFSINNLDVLKEKMIESLTSQGVKVHFAENSDDVYNIFTKIVKKGEKIVKSKSNTINEVSLIEKLKGRNEIVETDCGDFILKLCGKEPIHPVSPSIHIDTKEIVEAIRKKFNVRIKNDVEEIVRWIKSYVRKKILEADVGLTGANAISSDGGIVILENEGNISLITRIPKKHIIVAGIDKIVPTLEDAITVCKVAGIWGSGISLPTYINIISSPSKTLDVKKKLIYGVHGAEKIHLILVDNGRSRMIKEGFGELLFCINCGACLYFCPVFRQILENYGSKNLGGRGLGVTFFQEGIEKVVKSGLYLCTTCKACKYNCPVEIDIPEIIRRLRKKAIWAGFETKVNEKLVDNIEAFGNPFGEEVEEGKIPKELYCC